MSELALGKGAREIADALCEMAEDYGLSIRFQMGGKHPYAEFSKDGRSRKVWFAGSPSDHRAVNNSIREARNAFRPMGWEKEMVTLVSTGKGSMFDAQPVSQGPASPVKHIEPDTTMAAAFRAAMPAPAEVPMLRGVPLPEVPPIARQAYALGTHRGNPEYQKFIAERNRFIDVAMSAGASATEVSEALAVAGHAIQPSSVHAQRSMLRQRNGEAKSVERKPAAPSTDPLPGLMTQLEAIVSKIIEHHTADLQRQVAELRPKAEKWDAIKGLVSND